MTQHQTMEVCERDRAFCNDMRAAVRRYRQGKITAGQVEHIRQRLVRQSVRRYRMAEMRELVRIALIPDATTYACV